MWETGRYTALCQQQPCKQDASWQILLARLSSCASSQTYQYRLWTSQKLCAESMHALIGCLLAIDLLKWLLSLLDQAPDYKQHCSSAEGVLTKGRQVRSCVLVLLIRLRCCCLPLLFSKLLEHCAVNSVEALHSTMCHQLHPSNREKVLAQTKTAVLTALHAMLRYRLRLHAFE